MKSVIEYKCGHAIDWKEAFRLTADIIRYNHGGAVVANGNTAENLIYRAAQMGVTVRKYERSVEIMTRYGEPECLACAYDILTASKKRHPVSRAARRERKEAEYNAKRYNIRRYNKPNAIPGTEETFIQRQARLTRYLKETVTTPRKRCPMQELIYWTDAVTRANEERENEMNARMNYPAQVMRDLTGYLTRNRYEEELPF